MVYMGLSPGAVDEAADQMELTAARLTEAAETALLALGLSRLEDGLPATLDGVAASMGTLSGLLRARAAFLASFQLPAMTVMSGGPLDRETGHVMSWFSPWFGAGYRVPVKPGEPAGGRGRARPGRGATTGTGRGPAGMWMSG